MDVMKSLEIWWELNTPLLSLRGQEFCKKTEQFPMPKGRLFFCSVLGTMIIAVQRTGDASFGGREEHSETVALNKSHPVNTKKHHIECFDICMKY